MKAAFMDYLKKLSGAKVQVKNEEVDTGQLKNASARQLKPFRLSDFEVRETLGVGSFSRVRLCRHLYEDKFMAMKVMKKSDIFKLEQVEHLRSTLHVLVRIQHPFLLNLIGCFQDERRVYLVLDFLPGGELFRRIRTAPQARLEDEEAKFYGSEITLALEYLHGHDIVYRDLMPENLILDADGHVVLADFGFVKVVRDRTFTLCGSPEYAAPEILQGAGYGRSVDWWAFGILLHEMLCGYPPFYDKTPLGTYRKILDGGIKMPSFLSFKAKDMIQRLLVPNRYRRLGCQRGGAVGVKRHKWFSKLSWDALYNRQLKTPAGNLARSEHDTSNFDLYPDSEEDLGDALSGADDTILTNVLTAAVM